MPPHRTQKDESLEALRGIAALVVIAWHLVLGFAPARSGIFPGMDMALSWVGRPWYAIINGTAAVVFFFVLSGFVLTRQALLDGNSRRLVVGIFKRWPRLAGPAAASCAFSWMLFASGAYRFREAAAVTGSPWLADFAYSSMPPGYVPNLADALLQGGAWTFLTGRASYNSSLWTMRWELLGSFVAFATALLAIHLRNDRARFALLFVAAVVAAYANMLLVAFPAGVACALLSAQGRLPRFTAPATVLLLLLAFTMANYTENGLLGRLSAERWGRSLSEILAYTVGAVLLLVAVEQNAWLRRLLSGRVARFLGRMSFPVYLLHVPVLCSAGCMAFLAAGGGRAGLLAAAGATLLFTVLLGWPLAWFDLRWTRLINRIFTRS